MELKPRNECFVFWGCRLVSRTNRKQILCCWWIVCPVGATNDVVVMAADMELAVLFDFASCQLSDASRQPTTLVDWAYYVRIPRLLCVLPNGRSTRSWRIDTETKRSSRAAQRAPLAQNAKQLTPHLFLGRETQRAWWVTVREGVRGQ
jgi:hypothetical protein